ncbi:hypothetical protein Cco03nite_47570 [Catellatospora coxensis]|uniref:Uncharacterized protein n=1 Tax=Catellatospora coxensis TaxID=310354 RepID=A0A8J3P8T7_9ACTN|nr:hypothetical protein Cco03nite_47570 [Catellatospora coxensis]
MTGGQAERSGAVMDRARREVLGSALATEMTHLSAALWNQGARGRLESVAVDIDKQPGAADVIADAFDLAYSRPSAELVRVSNGAAGVVVLAHGPSWSVVARSGGPVLLLINGTAAVLRVDLDFSWQMELKALVSALVRAGRGLPPVDESLSPPPPSDGPWRSRR